MFSTAQWTLRSGCMLGPQLPQPMIEELTQAEKQRAERQNKRLAERTIDAQRASAPVPRCVSSMPRMKCSSFELFMATRHCSSFE